MTLKEKLNMMKEMDRRNNERIAEWLKERNARRE